MTKRGHVAMMRVFLGIAMVLTGWATGFVVGYGTVYASIISPQSVADMVQNAKNMQFTEQEKRESFLNTMFRHTAKPAVGIVP